jgi:TP901 family phage tail tape measure protein
LAKERLDFIISASVAEFSTAIKKAKGDLKSLAEAVKTSKAGLNKGVAATPGEKNARAEADALLATIKKLAAAERELTREQKARLAGQVAAYKAALQGASPSAQSTIKMKQESDAQKKFILEQKAIAAESRRIQRETQEAANRTITLRYALYDVGSTAQQASQAMLGFANSVLQAQMAQEQAFAQVEKTLIGVADQAALAELKAQLLELSTQIPLTFQDLTKIGMLGSQLGIASEDIAGFTEVVAKFSAITGISVEETSMGFGKIANLLGLNSSQYEALGAAIAKVGVSSAATEQQIINTAGQIGAVAKAAGFSASEIIGLSASLASLKVAPEESRGVLVQTFHQMDMAARSFNSGVKMGSERLRLFADIAGVSSEEFALGWGDKTEGGASRIWEKFISGLGNKDISRSLVQIGLDGVRTSKGLTALANSADSIFGPNGSLALAREAGASGSFLDESFGTIVTTLASKVKMLQTSFENLFASLGSNSALIDTFGFIVDSIKNINVALANAFNNNNILSGIAGIVVVVSAIGGALLAVVATISIALASFFALQTAYTGLAISGKATQGSLTGLIASLFGVTPAAKTAQTELIGVGLAGDKASVSMVRMATATRIAKYALVSTGIGAVILVLAELASVLMQSADTAEEAATGLDEYQREIKTTGEEAAMASAELQGFIDLVMLKGKNTLGVESALYSLGQALQKGKGDFSEYTTAGRANIGALQSVISAYATAAQGDQQALADNLQALMNYMISAGYATAESLYIVQQAILATGKTASGVVVNFASLADGFRNVESSAGNAKTALEKLDEILQKIFRNFNVRIGLVEAMDDLGASVAENGLAFGYGTEGMRNNLKVLQDTISAFKDSSNGDLTVFRGNILSLKAAMQQLGITSPVALKLVNDVLAKTGSKGKASAKEIATIFNNISNSIKKNSKTISDYVGDLNKALADTFSNRYGTEEAMDRISSAFNDMKESANNARDAIADAQREIQGIRADKNILEYQLSVAIRYGDTLRADSIRAKLAKANADLAEQEKTMNENQQTLNKTLTGTTSSAVENRAKLRDLVQSGNAYLLTLAQTGASSETLKSEAKKLADQFMQQGLSLGFAETELKGYLDLFMSDFTRIVDTVPKDITITVDKDPAVEALKAFVTQANSILTGIKFGIPTPSTGAGGVPKPNPKPTPTVTPPATAPVVAKDVPIYISPMDPLYANRQKDPNYLSIPAAEVNASRKNKPTPSPSEIAAYHKLADDIAFEKIAFARKPWYEQARDNWAHGDIIDDLIQKQVDFQMRFGKGYASGGFVSGPGTAGSDSIPARLSSGEYVIQANAVRHYGTDFMNALNNIQVQRQASAGVGGGSGLVYLSPEDRQLLRAAIERPINLYADSKQLASSVSDGNVSLARRGLN